VGVNTVADLVNGYPNGRGRITPHAATVAQILTANGYATYAVGKWHLTPPDERTPSGPFDNWPVQKGFDHFYGFLGGLTDQYHPELYLDNTPTQPPVLPAYHLSTDLVDHALAYVKSERASTPDKPYFLYLAFGAAHAPHQAPKELVEKYVPVFQRGWDAARQERFLRQKRLGLIPADTVLTAANPGIKAWDGLSSDEKRLFVKYQAGYAAYLDHADQQIGRLLDYLDDSKQIENTFIVVISDNGASDEGGFEGFTNLAKGYYSHYTHITPRNGVERGLAAINDIGTERASSHYPAGWAQLGNTPFRYYKDFVYGGGVNDPLIVHWPNGFKARGEIRKQFVDVIDITPTILDVLGIQAPKSYRGFEQLPIDGKSFLPVLNDAKSHAPRGTQYFELHGHRAIYHEGYKAIAFHKPGADFDLEKWELYDLTKDYSESFDLSSKRPELLELMKKLWWSEAEARGVLPLTDDPIKDAIRKALHPVAIKTGVTVLYPDQWLMPADSLVPVTSRPFTLEAILKPASSGVEGVILAIGDRDSGWVEFVQDDHLVIDINNLGIHTVFRSDCPVPLRCASIEVKIGGGHIDFLFDRKSAGSFAGGLGIAAQYGMLQIGHDLLPPVSPELSGLKGFPFTEGRLLKVTLSPEK
jgi:arylsulfatase